jgi:hypothetical protein
VANAAIAAVRARGAVVDSGALLVELVRGEPQLIDLFAGLGCDVAALERALAACRVVEAEYGEGCSRAAFELRYPDPEAWPSSALGLLLALLRPHVSGTPTSADELLGLAGVEALAVRRGVFLAAGGLVLAEDAVPWARWGHVHARVRGGELTAWSEIAADPALGWGTMCLAYLAAGPATIAWLLAGLTDVRRWSIAVVVGMTGVLHPALGLAMIDAGIREEDPSANRTFLRIGLWGCGHAAVRERLTMHLDGEDPALVEGVLRALYWTEAEAGVGLLPIAQIGRRFLRGGATELRRSLLYHLLRESEGFVDDAAWAVLDDVVAAAQVDADPNVRRMGQALVARRAR